MRSVPLILPLCGLVLLATLAGAQEPPAGPPADSRPGGFPPGGPGGLMNQAERKISARFDADGNGRLDTTERAATRAHLKANPEVRRGPGPPRFPGAGDPPAVSPGAKLSPSDIRPSRGSLYAEDTLRTLFINFESDDWESELEDFHNTDVDVPATLIVDGTTYPGVGLHFRGKSSYFMARPGQKRSLNLALDHTDPKLRLGGYKTLNLNNSFGDASLIGAALYSRIARDYIPAPKVNLVRVVINGEDWGIYQNQQQFDKDFLEENHNTRDGARWKAPGSPGGRSGLEDLGADLAPYKQRFEMKDGGEDDWQALVTLCRTLNQTPADQLEAALAPILDIEETLWFLALECVLMNDDGYWARASDFNLYRDPNGVFHLIPHDMNEAFRAAGHGPRGPGRDDSAASAPAFGLDPLVGIDDSSKPLRSKLLAVPALRQRYLDHVATIARDWLDWEKLGPRVASLRSLIKDEAAADTRKNGTTEAFLKLTASEPATAEPEPAARPQGRGRGGPPGGGAVAFRSFADARRAFLLTHPAITGSDEK